MTGPLGTRSPSFVSTSTLSRRHLLARAGLSLGAAGLTAINAVTGEIEWDTKVDAIVVVGATVVNDVVLSGTLAGDMIVFAAAGPLLAGPSALGEKAPGGPAGVELATSASEEPGVVPRVFARRLRS